MACILIVDDSPELLDFFSLLLSRQGYETHKAASKKEMFHKLGFLSPDIILLDVRLGNFNGRDICKEIKDKATRSDFFIILLSASPELLNDYQECRADAVIEKPFAIQSVIQTISQLLQTSVVKRN